MADPLTFTRSTLEDAPEVIAVRGEFDALVATGVHRSSTRSARPASISEVLVELNRGALEAAGSLPEAVIDRLALAGLTDRHFLDYPQQGATDGVPNFVNMLACRPGAG